jgi:hypothetical protein
VGVSTWLSDRLTQDALWLLLTSSPSLERRLVRLGIDARYGKFRGGPDTVLLVTEEPYDISEDGKAVVHGEGTYRYDTWGLALEEALRGEFLPPRHLKSSTSILDTRISPDGKHVLVAGQRESAFLVPFEGCDPRLLGSSSLVSQFGWMPDTNLLWFAERVGRFLHVQTADPITVKRQRVFSIDGPSIRETTPIVGGGWVWVAPPGAGILQVQLPEDSAPRSVRKPNDVSGIRNIISASDRARALMTGWNATGDSVLMYDISLRDGRLTRLASFFGEEVNASWLADGSILVAVQETIGIASIYRVRGPGRIEQVGVVPRPIGHRGHIFASLDGRRLGVTTEQYHGDIWLAKVSLTR